MIETFVADKPHCKISPMEIGKTNAGVCTMAFSIWTKNPDLNARRSQLSLLKQRLKDVVVEHVTTLVADLGELDPDLSDERTEFTICKGFAFQIDISLPGGLSHNNLADELLYVLGLGNLIHQFTRDLAEQSLEDLEAAMHT